MLCPFCLQEVTQFKEARQGGVRGYTCPQCQEAVPIRYVRDCQHYPPVIFTLVGLRGHGKTCYLAGLFQALEETAPRMWSGFSCTPVDEAGLAVVREKQQALAGGKLPDPTPNMFLKPAILQLNQVPKLGDWHLLAYDISGEAFEQVEKLQQYGGYLARSGVVVWLVSLKDMEKPGELIAFTVRYVETMLRLGGNPKEQKLLVVVTKGDELLENLPDKVRHFLANEGTVEEEKLFEEVSRGLENWLEGEGGYANFVREVRRQFKGVYYTIVSSLGARPVGQNLKSSARPRRVLAPLQWVIQLRRGRGLIAFVRKIRGWYQQLVAPQPMEEAAAIRSLASLTPWNPLHWFKLLYWALMRPEILNQRESLDKRAKKRLEKVGSWLSSTLIWGSLLLLLEWGAIRFLNLLFVAITEQGGEKDSDFNFLFSFWVWLFDHWNWVLVAIATGWLLTGWLGSLIKSDNVIGMGFIGGLIMTVHMLRSGWILVAGVGADTGVFFVILFVGYAVAIAVAAIVENDVAFGVGILIGGVIVGSVAGGVAGMVDSDKTGGLIEFGAIGAGIVTGIVIGLLLLYGQSLVEGGSPRIKRIGFAVLVVSYALMLALIGINFLNQVMQETNGNW